MRDLTRCATWPVHHKIREMTPWTPPKSKIEYQNEVFWVFFFHFCVRFPILCSFLRFLLLCCCFISIIPGKSSSPKSARLDPCITVSHNATAGFQCFRFAVYSMFSQKWVFDKMGFTRILEISRRVLDFPKMGFRRNGFSFEPRDSMLRNG